MKNVFYFVILGGLELKLEVVGALSGGCVMPYDASEVAEGRTVTCMRVTASRKSEMTSIFGCGSSFYWYGFLKVAAPCRR